MIGDHSAGLSTTELPAASAGAHFQVASMKGAFQGVMITAGAGGHAQHAVGGAVGVPGARLVVAGEVGIGAKVPRSSGDHPQLQALLKHRHVEAFEPGQAGDVSHR